MASKRCKAAGSAVPRPGLPERPREPREGLYSQPRRTDAGTVMRLSTDELVRPAPKLRAYLRTPTPTWPDIVDTAHWLRHDLGVSKPLWGEACRRWVRGGSYRARARVGETSGAFHLVAWWLFLWDGREGQGE
jgi:Replication protein C C-terminal region